MTLLRERFDQQCGLLALIVPCGFLLLLDLLEPGGFQLLLLVFQLLLLGFQLLLLRSQLLGIHLGRCGSRGCNQAVRTIIWGRSILGNKSRRRDLAVFFHLARGFFHLLFELFALGLLEFLELLGFLFGV